MLARQRFWAIASDRRLFADYQDTVSQVTLPADKKTGLSR
jgi:hypothetical protein